MTKLRCVPVEPTEALERTSGHRVSCYMDEISEVSAAWRAFEGKYK